MSDTSWLAAHPVAHRGLHDKANGVIENTLRAAEAAVAKGFAIEVDLQLSADGEAMVFHDFTLERLTEGAGAVAGADVATLKAIPFRTTDDRIPTLADLLDTVGGKSALFLEVKSRFDGAPALVKRMAAVLAGYAGPVAVMSFDPKVVDAARDLIPDRPRGIVAEIFGNDPHWDDLSGVEKVQNTHLMHAWRTRPDFVAFNVKHLPSFAAMSWRALTGAPTLTWTVRTDEDRARAARWADQMIFEGFVP
jgi:glycerophosphoryl diester phosphodiesterase